MDARIAIASTLVTLFVLQYLIDSATFTTVGIACMAVAFWYKTLAFGTFGWILWRLKGTTDISVTGRDLFWSLCAMAFFLAVAFTLSAIDRLTTPNLPIVPLDEFRIINRNLLIASVVGLVIFCSRFMDAVFQFVRDQYQEALRKAEANAVPTDR